MKHRFFERVFLVCLLAVFSLSAVAQTTETPDSKTNASDSTFLIYQEQLKELLKARGMPLDEINAILAQYNSYKVSSNTEFAKLLGSMYPANAGIAVLFYFYHNGFLQRVLFEPGELISFARIKLTPDSLFQLNKELNAALSSMSSFNRSSF